MDKKILAIMVAMVAVAVALSAVAFVVGEGGGGGGFSSGGFTSLFDELEMQENETIYGALLQAPEDWENGDDISVTDLIVDMSYDSRMSGNTLIYETTFWFVYAGDQWNDPTRGSWFYVPVDDRDGYMEVRHGQFAIGVETVTNLSLDYKPGDRVTLETSIVQNDYLALSFGKWMVEDTL